MLTKHVFKRTQSWNQAALEAKNLAAEKADATLTQVKLDRGPNAVAGPDAAHATQMLAEVNVRVHKAMYHLVMHENAAESARNARTKHEEEYETYQNLIEDALRLFKRVATMGGTEHMKKEQLILAYNGDGDAFAEMDANGDGEVSPEDILSHRALTFLT